MTENTIYIILSLIFGACFGSFITMIIHRLPQGEDIFIKRSYCPHCKKVLSFYSLIPIFSWLFQRGRCLHCKKRISIKYLLIELTTSLMFMLSYIKFGLSYNTLIIDLIIVVCIIMILTDLENMIILDSTQIALLILNIILVLYNNSEDILSYIYSSIIYFITIFFIGYIVKKWKNMEAIGWGDIKFITVIGLSLGYSRLPLFLFISGFVGTIFGFTWKKIKKEEYFPFAPALIISYLLILFWDF